MVLAFDFLLADRASGADRLPICVADSAAIPDCRNRRGRSSDVLTGIVLPSSENLAGAARNLEAAENAAWSLPSNCQKNREC